MPVFFFFFASLSFASVEWEGERRVSPIRDRLIKRLISLGFYRYTFNSGIVNLGYRWGIVIIYKRLI